MFIQVIYKAIIKTLPINLKGLKNSLQIIENLQIHDF